MRTRGILAVLGLLATAGCLEKLPPIDSTLTPGPPLRDGQYLFTNSDVLDIDGERAIYRAAGRKPIVFEATGREAVGPSAETRDVRGGWRYRIVRVECDPDWVMCPGAKESTDLYLTPTHARWIIGGAYARTREFDAIQVTFIQYGMAGRRGLQEIRRGP